MTASLYLYTSYPHHIKLHLASAYAYNFCL